MGAYFKPATVNYLLHKIDDTYTETIYTTSDGTKLVKYNLMDSASVFTVERVRPYLFCDVGQIEKEADILCGTTTFEVTKIIGYEEMVVWEEQQVNPRFDPLAPATDPLSFTVYSTALPSVKTHKLDITMKLSNPLYPSSKMTVNIGVLTELKCMLGFKKSDAKKEFKYYLTPYNSKPEDLVEYG
jgi:hypothetical protein